MKKIIRGFSILMAVATAIQPSALANSRIPAASRAVSSVARMPLIPGALPSLSRPGPALMPSGAAPAARAALSDIQPASAAANSASEPGRLEGDWQTATAAFDKAALTQAGREWLGIFPELESGERLTAMVLGASRGIGAAFAEELAKTGAFNLILVSQDPEKIQAKKRELAQRYPGIQLAAVAADLSEPASVDVVLDAVPAGLKNKLAVLIHSAGIAVRDGRPEVQRMMAIKGPAAGILAKKAADLMLARGNGRVAGVMVFVSSIASLIHIPGMEAYSRSNRAFNELAGDFAGYGGRILATASAPGLVMTNLVKDVVVDSFGLGPRTAASIAMPASEVAWESLSAARRGEAFVIPGRMNRELVEDYRRNPALRAMLASYASAISQPGPMRDWANAMDPYMAAFMPALIQWRRAGTAWMDASMAWMNAWAGFWGFGRRRR